MKRHAAEQTGQSSLQKRTLMAAAFSGNLLCKKRGKKDAKTRAKRTYLDGSSLLQQLALPIQQLLGLLGGDLQQQGIAESKRYL